MYEDEIKKSPYKGIFFTIIMLVGVPVGIFLIFLAVLTKNSSYQNYYINFYTAQALGFGCGFLFQVSCILCGLFKKCFKAVIKRVVGFFENLSISFKFAFKMYIDDLVEDGIVFWIYFIILSITLQLALSGFLNYMSLYSI